MVEKMASLINRFFSGIKAYFGSEFRYYTLPFLFFIVLLAILAPIFIILDIEKFNSITQVYIIGASTAVVYLIYMVLTMSHRMRDLFFRTKWKYVIGIIGPIGGTLGLSLLIYRLMGIIATQLYYIVTYSLLIAFLIWLIIQLYAFGLFIKDINRFLLEKIEENPEKRNRRFIIFTLIFEGGIILHLIFTRAGFTDVTKLISDNIFTMPFNLWILALVVTILSGVILLFTLIRKKYQLAFFSTGYILLYSLFLFYHLGYLMVLVYVPPALFIGTVNFLTLFFFTISIIYSLQALSGTVKTRAERWWQPISFFFFSIVLLYVTWSVTFMYNLVEYAGIPGIILEEYFWAINHFVSYILGIFLLIVTTVIFSAQLKEKKEKISPQL
ncbi:MAG: hypothetical protein EU536_00675 [Promethearchaeota archaeon]|nr:MAG: hypothetical protein EU536_00675 [Candidatus Lokiarchaeota archaeon]